MPSIAIPNSAKWDFDGVFAHLSKFGRWGIDPKKRFVIANWSWHTVVRIYAKGETIEVTASPRFRTMFVFGLIPMCFIASALNGHGGLVALEVAIGFGIGWLFWRMLLLSNTLDRMAKILTVPAPTTAASSESNQSRLVARRGFDLGTEFFANKQHQEAVACFDIAINLGFEDADIYGKRGLCLSSLGFDLDAIDDFDKAIAFDPENTHLYSMRSASKSNVGDLHGCVTDLQEAIRVAEIDNLGNRAIRELAKSRGNNLIVTYQLWLDMANMTLERQANYESIERESPGTLPPTHDLVSSRRAAARRRTQTK